jgi:glycosyltransferase involved in cell wall biosynthesis
VRTIAIQSGVDPSATPVDASEQGETPTIVWAGQFVERKAPLVAISAFGRVLQSYPGVTLVMLGDGPLRLAALRLADTVAPGRVIMKGFTQDVLEQMCSAQILLHTAVSEGVPYSIKEGMSVGLPVVATDAGATNEIVDNGGNGYLTRSDDPVGIATALNRLCCEPNRRKAFGLRSREICQERFSCGAMISSTIDAYSRLVGVQVCPHSAELSYH